MPLSSVAQQLFNGSEGVSPNHYVSLTDDGAWCWFSDPRAVSLNGIIYAGWVTSDGSVMVASYNPETGEVQQSNLYPQFNKDDHANPSLLILPDNRIMVFFTAHSSPGRGETTQAMHYVTSLHPEDITQWEAPQQITGNSAGNRGFCYTNPIMLSEENNRIYLFWRGGNFKPTFSYTDDLGKTWSDVLTLVESNPALNKRPYVKIASNGKDEIHFAFTDGHPRNEPFNSIYYVKYRKGGFYKADGTPLGTLETLPLKHEECDVVYDSPAYFEQHAFGIPSWIWDVAIDEKGNPVMVYTRLPTESEHRYWHATWNGSEWVNTKISHAGAWFPRYDKTKSMREPEPHYSGGVYIDHENTNVVYYSKPVDDVFEIFKAVREEGDEGTSWTETAITANSKHDNVRPFAIRGATGEQEQGQGQGQGQVLWMQNAHYRTYLDYKAAIKVDIRRAKPSTEFTRLAVKSVMKRVADWQVEEPLVHHPADWTNGALYAGMVAWAQMAGDSSYFAYLKEKGETNSWAQRTRTDPAFRYFADDYAVGQMYVEMFRTFGDSAMIAPLRRYFDYMLQYPSTRSLQFVWREGSYPTERWSWCDALFMGPPVWAKMANVLDRGDYLDFMHKEYMYTYNYLYDKAAHLFFRDDRYFDQREANGNKVFWGRGNGWVLAGLPAILEEVPKDWEHREFYETLFVEMAETVAGLQDEEGFWHASLLDPGSYPNPETSASAFFTYALAWGINNGYLAKKTYQPVVERGWQALVQAVYPDGKLGWVQPVGQDPKQVTADMTEVYGVGAFLLAGTEVYRLADR